MPSPPRVPPVVADASPYLVGPPVTSSNFSVGVESCVGPLTTVSESANEDATTAIVGGATNAYYDDFLRFTQEEDQQEQRQEQRAYNNEDDEDNEALFQTLVDPVSVGGFPSCQTNSVPQQSPSSASETIRMGSF